MHVLLINPPYQTITSNCGVGHQMPLGLLMLGGPLRDAGHTVRLLDAERRRMSCPAVAAFVRESPAVVVMTGHAGSTPAHPTCMEMLRQIKRQCPRVWTVYGGVYPTYHAAAIVGAEPAVDVIVRGEGESAAVEIADALRRDPTGGELGGVAGIACRINGRVVLTAQRSPLLNLDAWRVGWELIENWDDYQCFGLGRAAIVQFSRGCPHRCTYCGQHGFWQRWRHRDPVRLVDEIAILCRRHRIRFITLADENPTTDPGLWRALLEELAARRLPVHFFATLRAADIVRDAELLPLFRRAGILYVLMGVDATSDSVLQEIRKNSTTRQDLLASRLLHQHGIFSILGHVAGFEDETPRSLAASLRRLLAYDADYLNAMYLTPHDWTVLGQAPIGKPVIESDLRRWDYRHQVLVQPRLRRWQLFAAMKLMELIFHLRPNRLRRLLQGDAWLGRQRIWVIMHLSSVWLAEVAEFLLHALRSRHDRAPVRADDAAATHRRLALPVLGR
jgi:anaerobic magnesium-protoporphyrin IX monomethyl ester cyclase